MLCASDNWRLSQSCADVSRASKNARRACAAFALLIAMAASFAAVAQDSEPPSTPDTVVLPPAEATDGQFVIVETNTRVETDLLLLNAEIVYGLTRGAINGLYNGVPLLFETQIELDRSRRFLPDPNVVSLVQRSELTYHALTQRFVVRNFNSSEQTTHATLSEALKRLGQFQDLPIIDISLLDPESAYSIRMRSVLDTRSYAAPLRMLAALFQVDDWRLESSWERWLITL